MIDARTAQHSRGRGPSPFLRDTAVHDGRTAGDSPTYSAAHSSFTVTTGRYVEVIEAVQRDALDSIASLFDAHSDACL